MNTYCSEGIAPCFLTPAALPLGSTRCPLDTRLGGVQNRPGCGGVEKKSQPLPEINRSLVTILTELPRLFLKYTNFVKSLHDSYIHDGSANIFFSLQFYSDNYRVIGPRNMKFCIQTAYRNCNKLHMN